METSSSGPVHLALGTQVTLAMFPDSRPVSCFGTVTSEAPLCIKPASEAMLALAHNLPAMVIWRHDDETVKIDATAIDLLETVDGMSIHLEQFKSQILERRASTRIGLSVPVALRLVDETPEGVIIKMVQGTTRDISESGVWVESEGEIAVGSLIEFQAHLSDTEIARVLSVVVRCDAKGSGIGVSFLEHAGHTQQKLREYLHRAA